MNLKFFFQEILENYRDIQDELWQTIRENRNKGDFATALEQISDFHKNFGAKFYSLAGQAQCLNGLSRVSDALNTIELAFAETKKLEKINPTNLSWLNKIKGEILEKQQDVYGALQHFQTAFTITEEHDEKLKIGQQILKLYQDFKTQFTNLPFANRKFVLIDNEYKDLSLNEFIVLKKNDLPDLKFPVGHPLEKELYVGHPYKDGLYIPLDNYEEFLFLDRYQEFRYFLQCLGAKKIAIESRRGKNSSTMQTSENEMKGEVNVGKMGVNIASGKAEIKNEQASINTETDKKNRTTTQLLNPTRKPYLPDDLRWFPHESDWQGIYNQRVNGVLLNHNEIISSESIKFVSAGEKKNLKAQLQIYMTKIKFDKKSEDSSESKVNEKIEWAINVEFAPLSELNDNEQPNAIALNSSKPTDNKFVLDETSYMDEIKFMLEDDNEIDSNERRLLDRKREKLGISPERAKEIEDSIINKKINFSKEELDFIEYIKECITDGVISQEDRRIIQRRAEKLGIPTERSSELENFVMNKQTKPYTDDEIKYIEELKFCLEDDNEISASERRLLNKERDNLSISHERAEKIEQDYVREIKK